MHAGEVGGERPRVVLVEQAEVARTEPGGRPGPENADVHAEDARRPGRQRVEAGDRAQQGRLAGSARPEDDDDLALLDLQRQALERD